MLRTIHNKAIHRRQDCNSRINSQRKIPKLSSIEVKVHSQLFNSNNSNMHLSQPATCCTLKAPKNLVLPLISSSYLQSCTKTPTSDTVSKVPEVTTIRLWLQELWWLTTTMQASPIQLWYTSCRTTSTVVVRSSSSNKWTWATVRECKV